MDGIAWLLMIKAKLMLGVCLLCSMNLFSFVLLRKNAKKEIMIKYKEYLGVKLKSLFLCGDFGT